MIAVHWSPVCNVKKIRRNGIAKSPTGLYCHPLVPGLATLRWWANFFRKFRPHTRYHGYLFKVEQADLPAYLGDWFNNPKQRKIQETENIAQLPAQSLAELEYTVREAMLFRLGEYLFSTRRAEWMNIMGWGNEDIDVWNLSSSDRHNKYCAIGARAADEHRAAVGSFMRDPGCMIFTFEDFELVLSQSIRPDRIIRVLSDTRNSGRQRRRTGLDDSDADVSFD